MRSAARASRKAISCSWVGTMPTFTRSTETGACGASGTRIAVSCSRATRVNIMRISRRQFGALGSAAMLAPVLRAHAAAPDVLVPGWNLPANVVPHQVMDVPAQNVAFNLYDNLYRYQDNPPTIVPWLAESHTV